jgi:signal peptidase I
MAIVTHLLSALVTHTRLLLSFQTMVATLLVLLCWKLIASAEAAYTSATAKKPEAPVPLPRFTYSLLAVIIFLAAFFPTLEHVKRESGFNAFKVPSTSMCPTICGGDRVVADTWAYRSKPPQHGDIILLKHPSSGALFVKRVIALPGDLVAPGPGGSVLVNGQSFHPPTPCGNPIWPKGEPANYSSMFQPTKVPDGTLFVVGDNLDHSFDSRVPAFGPVTPDMVRGKPLYFYWSLAHSRIACSIH